MWAVRVSPRCLACGQCECSLGVGREGSASCKCPLGIGREGSASAFWVLGARAVPVASAHWVLGARAVPVAIAHWVLGARAVQVPSGCWVQGQCDCPLGAGVLVQKVQKQAQCPLRPLCGGLLGALIVGGGNLVQACQLDSASGPWVQGLVMWRALRCKH